MPDEPREEQAASEELKCNDVLANNPIAAASDVTLTPDIADEPLPVELKAEETDVPETDPVCAPITAPDSKDDVAPPSASALERHESSSGPQEPSPETESGGTVYIDITGTFALRQPSKRATHKLDNVKTDHEEAIEKQIPQEEIVKVDTTDTSSKILETPEEEIEEAEEKVSEPELESDERDTGVQSTSTTDEVQVMVRKDELELEIERIKIPESDGDEADSPSVFSTCDEWMESPGSGRIMEDQVRSLPALTEDLADSIAGLAEPDEIDSPPMTPCSSGRGGGTDSPPMAPRSTGPGVEMLLQPAEKARSTYGHGDVAKSSGDRKSAKMCFHCARGVDRNAGDRQASSHAASSSSIQAPRPPKRRPQSATAPPLGGRIPHQSGRAPSTSNGAPRPTPVPAGVSRTATRSSNSTSTRYSPPPHPRERARTIKPISQNGRKPAWK